MYLWILRLCSDGDLPELLLQMSLLVTGLRRECVGDALGSRDWLREETKEKPPAAGSIMLVVV